MLALGLASYLSLYPALLLPPSILLCYDRQARNAKAPPPMAGAAATYTSAFAASVAWFLYLSTLLTGNFWEFLSSTYGVHLLLPDLTPNVGLWWYFFIEMFDSFREFFLGVFWLHLGSYVGGLCVRLRKQPLFVIVTLLGIFAIFKPYPSLADTSLWFAVLPLYRHVFPCECLPIYLLCMTAANAGSDAIYIHRYGYDSLCHFARPCLLLPLDLCRVWQCQLLLRHHARLELGALGHTFGLAFCSPEG